LANRGGLPSEPRVEIGRKNLGDRWFYADSGAPVGGGHFEDGSVSGDVAKIKSDDGVHGKLTVLNRDLDFMQTVPVVRRA
jgi:hypothetical protein